MSIPSWNDYFLMQCDHIATRSKDPNTHFGAIIVDTDNTVLAQGYNSLPRGVRDLQSEVPERFVRPLKYLWMEHAERNAIYTAARKGIRLQGARIYVQALPCVDCARAIIQAGLTRLIVDRRRVESYKSPRYTSEEFERVVEMLREGSVCVCFHEGPTNVAPALDSTADSLSVS